MIEKIRNLDYNKTLYSFKMNWIDVILFVFFWSYGVFGFLILPELGLPINIGISLIFVLIFIWLCLIRKDATFFYDYFFIRVKDILVIVSYLVFMLLLSYHNLILPINGDQYYHSQQAKIHSLTIANFVTNYTNLFDNFQFANVSWVIDMLIVSLIHLAYVFLKKRSDKFLIIFFAIILLITRTAEFYMGGNASAFPPFRLFPVWFSSFFFSYSDFGFRVGAFLGLVVLMFLLQKHINKVLHFRNSFLFGLFVGTIPVLWHVGTIVEASLWASFCLIIVLLFINDWAENKKINYVRITSLIIIFSMMRVSAFVALFPVFLMLFWDWKNSKVSNSFLFFVSSLVLVILPVIVANSLIGTPATYRGVESLVPHILANSSLFERLFVVLDSGAFFAYVYNSIRFPLLIFLLLLPFLIVRKIKKFSLVILFFIFEFILFYSIDPLLWGNGRYQAEYIIPFVVLSAYLLFVNLSRKTHLVTAILVILISFNVNMYISISKYNTASKWQVGYSDSMKVLGDYFVLSEMPFASNDALKEAMDAGYGGSIYFATANGGYGYFSQIINGYSVSEIRKERKIYSDIGNGVDDKTVGKILKNSNVKIILIGGSPNSKDSPNELLTKSLIGKGWRIWDSFPNEDYGTVIYSLKRND